jgi:sigma-B regulation protein RsbU (phosphoserine phosphatase)
VRKGSRRRHVDGELSVVYATGRVRLCDDDVLLLYTDGITEATDASDIAFGDDSLMAALAAAPGDAAGVLESVTSAYRAFNGAELAADDVTLVVARLKARTCQEVRAC